jgi:hypothetical protein
MTMTKKSDRRLAPKDPYFAAENPKDLVSQAKLDLSLIPETFLIELAMAFYEGALKYGRYNWRMAPVKASVYLSAFDRHVIKWGSGEERDKSTGTHHLGYAGCCLAIMIDAQRYGTLVDDRAPRGRLDPDTSAWLDGEIIERVKKLQNLFKDQAPKQFTIADNFHAKKGPKVRRAKKATLKQRMARLPERN